MTPWRKMLYDEIKNFSFEGKVLDLGGSDDSDYHSLIGGRHSIETVNIDEGHSHDFSFNLEKPFPISDSAYDAVLAINVMEHIFNYGQFLREALRILKPGGTLIIAVPFLVQIHPSPNDYFRFTGEALGHLLVDSSFTNISIKPIGRGPFYAGSQISYNALKFSFLRVLSKAIGIVLDTTLGFFDRKNNFGAANYPLGYFVVAKKG